MRLFAPRRSAGPSGPSSPSSVPLVTAASPAGSRIETQDGRRTVRTWGSVSAAAFPDAAEAEGPRLAIEVPEGTDRLRAVFYLHGRERVRAALHDPGGRVEVLSSEGTGPDAQVAFDVVLPAPGTWVLEAVLLEPAVLRCWAAQADLEPA